MEKENITGQWWLTPLIPALGRQRQADFVVRGQPGLQSYFQETLSQKNKKKKEEEEEGERRGKREGRGEKEKEKEKKKKKKKKGSACWCTPITPASSRDRQISAQTQQVPGQPGLHAQNEPSRVDEQI
jgi:hypothetical protein